MISKVRSSFESFICWIISDRVFHVWGWAFIIFCLINLFMFGLPIEYVKHLARGLVIFIKEYVLLGLF